MEIFNGIAHLAMIILVLELLVFFVVPVLGIGLAGRIASGFIRKRAPRWLPRLGKLPRQALVQVEKGCNVAAWPVIRTTSLWRGVKTAVAALRRQAIQKR